MGIRQNALKSTNKQRLRQHLKEQHPLETLVEVVYRLNNIEKKLEDYNEGDFDKVVNRTHDMGRAIAKLATDINNLRQQTDSS